MDTSNPSFILGTPENPLCTIKLIDGEEAIKEFSKIDQFIANMSEFDLQSRLQTTEKVTTEDYIQFITKQIIPWTPDHIRLLFDIITDLNTNSLDVFSIAKLPPTVLVILTNGKDESGAAYCRNLNTVVLPITKLPPITESNIAQLASGNEWQTTFPHELFHIISRNNITLQNKLYKEIGYNLIPDNKVANLPKILSHLKVTNPDAPLTKHYIELPTNTSETPVKLAPIIIASKQYSPDDNKNFFDYIDVLFGILDDDWNIIYVTPYDAVIGLHDKIGNNTDYIMHPEETLADNFVLLVQHKTDIPSPEIPAMMFKVFSSTD